MLDLRHSAEQRGHFSPLGRLLSLQTAHGLIQWPSENGEGVGPDLALGLTSERSTQSQDQLTIDLEFNLIILGQWAGLPALRKNSTTPCPKCRHACDICTGSGEKLCEGIDCGGRGWIPGMWVSCPGPGCHKDTGQYKSDCATCATSDVRGQMREQVECKMCHGTGQMVCSRCRGTGKFSTGHANGSLDWRLPKCKACAGTGWKGTLEKQNIAKFTNAELVVHKNPRPGFKSLVLQSWLALGPIHAFSVMDFQTNRPRTFEVSADEKGDLLMLLVPASPRQKPQKAYLVGGIVRERGATQGAA